MIRVLVADDHALVRRGLREVLSDHPDMELAGEAADFPELLTAVRSGVFDVAVVDIRMTGGNILDALRTLHGAAPDLPVLVLSGHPAEQFAVRMLRAGARGYVEKDVAAEELVSAIRTVTSGNRYVSRKLAGILADEVAREGPAGGHHSLSDREFLVVQMIAEGLSVTEIAARVHLSAKTVSTYRTRALKKLGLRSNAEIGQYAVRHGLIA